MNMILLFDLCISNLSTSGLIINSNIQIIIADSYIAYCTADFGAGINAENGTLILQKTCLHSCSATVQGSAIRSLTESHVNLTAVSWCSHKSENNDDLIDFEFNFAEMNQLNTSHCYSKQTCGVQFSSCTSIKTTHNIYAHGNGSYIFQQHYIMTSSINHCYEIYINNTVSMCTIALFNPKPVHMVGCVFKDNKTPLMIYSDNALPSITFEDVVYLDNAPIGTDVPISKTTGDIPIPGPKQELMICGMFFENNSCKESTTVKIWLVLQVTAFLHIS